ncbi:MAG: cytochrome c biogenesis protein CcdA [Ktedonobacteraceae bacterium]
MNPSQINIGVAFVAGLVSFLSPCVLPLVPIYLAQLVGQSVYQSEGEKQVSSERLVTFLHAALFVLGFTLAFVALGATASTLGGFLRTQQFLLRQIGGVLLILVGLHLTGLLRIPLLYWQKRFEFRPARPSYSASVLTGVVFAIGWSPCVGPILGVILALAGQAATLRQGVILLLVYSLGLGVPFLLLGLGLNQVSRILKWLKPHLGKIEIGTGILMIGAGIVIFFNMLLQFSTLFRFGTLL